MKIKLDNWKVVKADFLKTKEETREENSFDLRTGHFFPEDNLKSFGVGFEIEIKDKEFDLFVEALFVFFLEEDITEEFKLSDFPKVNAPAIAFPYLRAFISNFTLNAGYQPVMLPSINFVRMNKKEES